VLALEKLTSARDYYFEPNEGDWISSICLDRHGSTKGSNYLFFDGHAELRLFKDRDAANAFLDPWTTRNVGISSDPNQ
jgi:prepilin-type processing-associated H-X9-DG protein